MERVALLAHGAGSSPEVVARLLAPCIPPDARVVAPPLRGDVDSSADLLADLASRHEIVLAAGISLGSHALALVASRTQAVWPLVLALPAWTGAPGAVASATAAAADEVATLGRDAVLARLRSDRVTRGDWVLEELAAGWSAYDDDTLAHALAAAARSRGPELGELRAVVAPTAVVALAQDPLHPDAVARSWASALTAAALRVVPRDAPAAQRGALGAAAVDALAQLSGSR